MTRTSTTTLNEAEAMPASAAPAQTVEKKPWKKFGRFRLLRGIHVEDGPDGNEAYYKAVPGQPPPEFDSKDDLSLLNGINMTPKFERVLGQGNMGERSLAPQSREKLNSLQLRAFEVMTVDELKKFAEEEEIDTGTAKTKDELVKVLKTAYS